MASKANQGLQIALIIFVVLFVGACVMAYVFFSKWEEVFARATDNEKRGQQSDSERAKLEIDLKDLKVMLGVGPDESVPQVKETHKKDMEAYGQALLDAQPVKERDVRVRQVAGHRPTTMEETDLVAHSAHRLAIHAASICRSCWNRDTTALLSMPSLISFSATRRFTGSDCSAR